MSRNTIEENLGLWDAFTRGLPKYGPMRERGLYKEQIERYYKYFNRSQILILEYEELNTNPGLFIKKVFNFLKVEDSFLPSCLNTNIKHKRDTSEPIKIHDKDIENIREYYESQDSLLTTES